MKNLYEVEFIHLKNCGEDRPKYVVRARNIIEAIKTATKLTLQAKFEDKVECISCNFYAELDY